MKWLMGFDPIDGVINSCTMMSLGVVLYVLGGVLYVLSTENVVLVVVGLFSSLGRGRGGNLKC